MTRFLRLFIIVATFIGISVSVRAEDALILKRVNMTLKGQLQSLCFQAGNVEMVIDPYGHILGLYLSTTEDFNLEQRISGNNRIETINGQSLDYRYLENGDLRSIGNINVVFDPFYPDILESVGRWKFSYYFIGDKPSKIHKAASIEFIYRFPDDRVEEIGGASFEYSLMYDEWLSGMQGRITYDSDVEIHVDTRLPGYIPAESDSLR